MTDCPAIRQGDEVLCTRTGCGMRWGLDEDRPECLMARRMAEATRDGPYSTLEPGLIGGLETPADFETQLAELRERIAVLETTVASIRNANERTDDDR